MPTRLAAQAGGSVAGIVALAVRRVQVGRMTGSWVSAQEALMPSGALRWGGASTWLKARSATRGPQCMGKMRNAEPSECDPRHPDREWIRASLMQNLVGKVYYGPLRHRSIAPPVGVAEGRALAVIEGLRREGWSAPPPRHGR